MDKASFANDLTDCQRQVDNTFDITKTTKGSFTAQTYAIQPKVLKHEKAWRNAISPIYGNTHQTTYWLSVIEMEVVFSCHKSRR